MPGEQFVQCGSQAVEGRPRILSWRVLDLYGDTNGSRISVAIVWSWSLCGRGQRLTVADHRDSAARQAHTVNLLDGQGNSRQNSPPFENLQRRGVPMNDQPAAGSDRHSVTGQPPPTSEVASDSMAPTISQPCEPELQNTQRPSGGDGTSITGATAPTSGESEQQVGVGTELGY